MVTAASGIRTLAEVDRPGVRVVGIANTTTIRAAGRSLINTVPIAVTSIDDAVAMLRAGQADAFALGRDSLRPFVAEFPGSHIVDTHPATQQPGSPSRPGPLHAGHCRIVRHNCSAVDVRIVVQNDVQQ